MVEHNREETRAREAIRAWVPVAVRHAYEDALREAQRAGVRPGRKVTHDVFVGAVMLEILSWPPEQRLAMVRRRVAQLEELLEGGRTLEELLAQRYRPEEIPVPGGRVIEQPRPAAGKRTGPTLKPGA